MDHRLIVRRISEQRFDIVQIFVCLDAIQAIEVRVWLFVGDLGT
jgi:hypothetical protein